MATLMTMAVDVVMCVVMAGVTVIVRQVRNCVEEHIA